MQLWFHNKNKQTIGGKAEKIAEQYLLNQGLKRQTKNFHCRFGEIDLIMQEKDTLVFIEVRCRKENAQVSASESISFEKIKKIRKTAKHYLLGFDIMPECRFDVVAVTYCVKEYRIDWIKNAF